MGWQYSIRIWESGERGFRESGEELLAQAEPNPTIMSSWSDIEPLIYLQKVEGLRPDAQLMLGVMGDRYYVLAIVQMTVGSNRPLYVHAYPGIEFLETHYALVPVVGSSWFRVMQKQ